MKAAAKLYLNGKEMDVLIDSDSSGSYIHPSVTEHYSLKIYYSNMDTFIKEEGLEGTFIYLDNVTVYGITQK